MNVSKFPLTGSCICGAVQVSVTALPLLTFACHCRDCQKLTASAFSLTAMIPRVNFAYTGALSVGGLHSEERAHHFCASCQNFVFSEMKRAPERINLRTSILDEGASFPPFVELMTVDKLSWSSVPAVHSYEQGPTTLDELQKLMDDYSRQQ